MTDSTDKAPERIWADGNQDWDSGSWGQDKEYANDVEYVRADCIEELEANLAKAVQTISKVREDVNWMLNEKRFLNHHVFDYLDTTLAELKGEK